MGRACASRQGELAWQALQIYVVLLKPKCQLWKWRNGNRYVKPLTIGLTQYSNFCVEDWRKIGSIKRAIR